MSTPITPAEVRAIAPRIEPAISVVNTLLSKPWSGYERHFPDGLPIFVWPGVTAGCQDAADERIPVLLQVQARGPRVVSVEPMTGPVDLKFCACETCCRGDHPGDCSTCAGWGDHSADDEDEADALGFASCEDCDGDGLCSLCGGSRRDARIGWVICGGESGAKSRPSHPDWFRALRDQCVAESVPFHFKQYGEFSEVAEESRDPETGDHVTRDPDDPDDAATFVPGLSVGVAPDGRVVRSLDAMEEGVPYRHMKRIGKTAAGRLLDGREWNEVPNV